MFCGVQYIIAMVRSSHTPRILSQVRVAHRRFLILVICAAKQTYPAGAAALGADGAAGALGADCFVRFSFLRTHQ
jgi:hypothetical protein